MNECIKTRRTGRSTGRALEYIANTYKNPGYTVLVINHYPTNREMDKLLLETISGMINTLNLTGFVIDYKRNTLMYQGLCNCDVIKQAEKICPCKCPDCQKAKL